CPFQDAPRREYFARFTDRRLGNHRAAIRHQRDDPFVRESLQHLAQARAPETEDLTQPFLDEPRLGWQAVVDDGRPDLLVDLDCRGPVCPIATRFGARRTRYRHLTLTSLPRMYVCATIRSPPTVISIKSFSASVRACAVRRASNGVAERSSTMKSASMPG